MEKTVEALEMEEVRFNAAVLARVLKALDKFRAREETVPMLSGVCLFATGDTVTMAATDRYKLGAFEFAAEDVTATRGKLAGALYIPPDLVKALMGFLSSERRALHVYEVVIRVANERWQRQLTVGLAMKGMPAHMSAEGVSEGDYPRVLTLFPKGDADLVSGGLPCMNPKYFKDILMACELVDGSKQGGVVGVYGVKNQEGAISRAIFQSGGFRALLMGLRVDAAAGLPEARVEEDARLAPGLAAVVAGEPVESKPVKVAPRKAAAQGKGTPVKEVKAAPAKVDTVKAKPGKGEPVVKEVKVTPVKPAPVAPVKPAPVKPVKEAKPEAKAVDKPVEGKAVSAWDSAKALRKALYRGTRRRFTVKLDRKTSTVTIIWDHDMEPEVVTKIAQGFTVEGSQGRYALEDLKCAKVVS